MINGDRLQSFVMIRKQLFIRADNYRIVMKKSQTKSITYGLC